MIAGIGHVKPIKKVELISALKKGNEAQSFSFSRMWCVPRTVLQLSSGWLAILNVSYLVADDELSGEGLPIGRPVLEHLKVDTKRILEENRATLDGIDYSPKNGGYVSMVMTSRSNFASNVYAKSSRSKINYFHSQENDDPFPDANLLDAIDMN